MKSNLSNYQIECKDLILSYDGKIVLQDVSFAVEEGDYLCIVGENGSGKSTLAKALLSLKRPSGGEIIFGNGAKSGRIGYLPQQTSIQKNFPVSVSEVVLSGCLGRVGFRPFYSAADRKNASSIMEKLGISHIARSCYRELSGGQQQRVLLARALLAAEKILVLDEPTNGLDPIATRELYGIIEDLNKNGMTIIMISHDFSSALHYATKILHLDRTMKFFGTKEDYIKSADFGRLSGGEENA